MKTFTAQTVGGIFFAKMHECTVKSHVHFLCCFLAGCIKKAESACGRKLMKDWRQSTRQAPAGGVTCPLIPACSPISIPDCLVACVAEASGDAPANLRLPTVRRASRLPAEAARYGVIWRFRKLYERNDCDDGSD